MHPPGSAPPAFLSLIVPAYNEAACLERNVRAILAHATTLVPRVEVLVVDDGSRDETRAIADRLAAEDGRIRPLANPRNEGKGSAVRRGMLAARGDVAVFLDADLSAPITTLEPMLDAFAAGADVVVGSRRIPGAEIAVHQPQLRELLGRGFTWLTRTWLGVPLADFTCGFKGFRAGTVAGIFERQRLNDWSFDAEVCFLAARQGYRIVQVPVVWTDDPETTVRVGSAMVGALLGLWRIRWWHVTGVYGL